LIKMIILTLKPNKGFHGTVRCMDCIAYRIPIIGGNRITSMFIRIIIVEIQVEILVVRSNPLFNHCITHRNFGDTNRFILVNSIQRWKDMSKHKFRSKAFSSTKVGFSTRRGCDGTFAINVIVPRCFIRLCKGTCRSEMGT